MTVKNVIKGLINEYNLDEINIISLDDDQVIYSGTVEKWKATSVDLLAYKKEIENKGVQKRIMFNNRKVFIFI